MDLTTNKEIMEYHIPFKLRDYQHKIFDTIDSGSKNFIVTAPTGAGKTLVAEFYIMLARLKGKKAVFTCPLKSLSAEKITDWQEKKFWVRRLSNIKVLMDTGDTTINRLDDKDFYNEWNVLVTTNERLDVIMRSRKNREKLLLDVEYIIFDETHLLGSAGRGGTVEYLMMALKNLLPEIKVVGLSATLPNAREFSAWLKSDLVEIPFEKRPVPLEYIYETPIKRNVTVRETNAKLFQLLDIIRQHRDEQFLVFVSSRSRAEKVAHNLILKLHRIPCDNSLQALIKRKVAYHHAGLNVNDRNNVVKLFMENRLKIIVATPTLAQGINLPCTNVVLFNLSRWSVKTGATLISDYEIQQMSGRAGRPQFDTLGRCFILGNKEEIPKAKEMIENPKDMISQIDDYLEEKVLATFVSGMANSLESAADVFKQSFGYLQKQITDEYIYESIDFLTNNGFLEITGYNVRPTYLGNLTSKMYLKPRTIIQVKNNIKQLKKNLNPEHIIDAFLCTSEMLNDIRLSYHDNDIIDKTMSLLPTLMDTSKISTYNNTFKTWLNEDRTREFYKMKSMVFSDAVRMKIHGFGSELPHIRRMAEQLIGRIYYVLRVNKLLENISDNDIKLISKMVAIGTINPKKAELMTVAGIGVVLFNRLDRGNVKTIEKFLSTRPDKLAKLTGRTVESIKKMKSNMMEQYPEYSESFKGQTSLSQFLN